ncbi:MAG TPA: efflux RND transporter periplasmic adaptor subunit [Chitinophagaceae bacterium]|jgi:membrane fusion protein (multidrug efflux system)|nr:efflux RND transporter periplasmic adaptor subunit [Chitinophagaceae bacterium]
MKNALLVALLFSTCMAACSSKKESSQKKNAAAPNRNAPTTVEGFVVRTSTVSNSIEVPGNLMPFESTELHPEVSGRVVLLNVKEGSYVTKGTLLVKLFDGDLQAQLKKLQVQLSISEQTVQRQGELLKISGISQQEYDLSSLNVNNIAADIDVIRTNIQKTEIRAPFNGRLGLRSISMGAYVTPATVIATIQQVSQLKLEFTVPEKYSSSISVGQLVTFTTEGTNKKFQARVIATEAAVTETSRSLRIRGAVTSKDTDLLPGAFAKVRMDFGKDNKALLVPTQAIIPGSRNKQVIIYRGGIAKFAVVNTGVRDSSNVQVTTGLNAGDTIVITGLLSIKPEGKLKLSKVISPGSLAASGQRRTADSLGSR